MTELRQMLEDTVDKLFRDLMASGMPELASESLPPGMWQQVEEMGIPNLFLDESAGGFNGCYGNIWRFGGGEISGGNYYCDRSGFGYRSGLGVVVFS